MINPCVLNIVSSLIAFIAVAVAVYNNRMSCKIQFLVMCYIEFMEIGRMQPNSLYYQQRLDALLDKIVFLGDDFRSFTVRYRKNSLKTSLTQLDDLFKRKMDEYKRYIKVNPFSISPIPGAFLRRRKTYSL